LAINADVFEPYRRQLELHSSTKTWNSFHQKLVNCITGHINGIKMLTS